MIPTHTYFIMLILKFWVVNILNIWRFHAEVHTFGFWEIRQLLTLVISSRLGSSRGGFFQWLNMLSTLPFSYPCLLYSFIFLAIDSIGVWLKKKKRKENFVLIRNVPLECEVIRILWKAVWEYQKFKMYTIVFDSMILTIYL